ncbi:hypothetical protein TD95_004738 [Thielaviopsis punctulata]|uniref:protein-histidine N-methyltransferase n=1 Tax=Thielaviopsis punctulata TaxID=72032 RepID=A0A0F4Z890_9PEZI|nr:hypothetical protein TD95_004738 [Thielaviopsis punctulata]
MSFAFGFSGDDIDENMVIAVDSSAVAAAAAEPKPEPLQAGAFPVEGQPQLPALAHSLDDMVAALPSKVVYNTLDIVLDDGKGVVQLPRRELWDVRVQLMAEDEVDGKSNVTEGLGTHDVKTGVYEGGFKSWESSVDLIKVLANERYGIVGPGNGYARRVMELGCGTALPSLAIFQQALHRYIASPTTAQPTTLIMADYNPSVMQLVTLPNFLLTWALACRTSEPALSTAFSIEDEVELTDDVRAAFKQTLRAAGIQLHFLSGGWSREFVDLLYTQSPAPTEPVKSAMYGRLTLPTIIMGAETIYSPFALKAFAATQYNILSREAGALSLVAAKRLYFGVGGSLDDFIAKAEDDGAHIESLREETQGVVRGVVECRLS